SFFFQSPPPHRSLHSFPTRRSSDLLHEADVAVGDHRLDFQVTLLRNEDQQGLRRGDDAADGVNSQLLDDAVDRCGHYLKPHLLRSEEHTSELQSRSDLVCRLLLEKK